METSIEFNFIYSKDAIKVKSYLGTVPRNIECINYMDIFNKLTKNDFYQFEPSDAVVSSYLMKQLQTVLDRTTTTSIFYVLGNLNEHKVKGIKTTKSWYFYSMIKCFFLLLSLFVLKNISLIKT